MLNQKIINISILIVLTLALAIAIVFARAAFSPPEPIPAPPIAQDLPADFASADFAFNEKLKKDFPIGSSASELATRLNQEGFKIDIVGSDGNYATLQRSYGSCTLIWAVSWRANSQAKVRSIRGDHSGKCL